MSRAKIVFYPKVGTENYLMSNVEIIDKYSNWKYTTDDFIEDGYVLTDDVTTGIADVNSKYWITFKPKQGYKFISVHKTNSMGTSNAGEFTINDDGSVTIYPWNSGTATIVNNYLYIEIVENNETSYTVESNLTNCTSDHMDYYEDGTDVVIMLTAKEHYEFDTVPTLTMNGNTFEFIVSDDKLAAGISFVITNNVVINATATHTPYKLTTDLKNCICNFNDIIPYGKNTITITANQGYILNGVISITANAVTNTYDDFTQNSTTFSITLDVTSDIEIIAEAILQPEQISTFTNLYKVDNNILNELAKVRFYEVDGEIFDYGTFINSLIKLPFELPALMIGSKGSIQLGIFDSNVEADVIQNYVLYVNMGSITINEKYHNIYDYKDTRCILHLPYCENIELEIEYVINHTITIEYKIDLYSGNATANVISDFTNEIVASKSFNVAKHIPFIQEQNNSIVFNVKNILDNGVRTAFIEVVRNIPYNTSTMFGNETVDYGILENYAGYIKVSDIMLNINATNEEKNELENILKNGVYINE